MLKKGILFLLVLSLLAGLVPASYVLASEETTIFLKPSDFKDHLGTWNIVPKESGSFGELLKAPDTMKPATAQSALTTLEIPAAGDYFIWARSRDFAAAVDAGGAHITASTRFYQLCVGGQKLEPKLGTHGTDGWAWELAGSVKLDKGTTLVEVIDTANYLARCEAIVLTTNPNFKGPATENDLNQAFSSHAGVILPTEVSPSPQPTAFPVPSKAPPAAPLDLKPDKHYIVLTPDSFQSSPGSWTIHRGSNTSESLLGTIMTGLTANGAGASQPATAKYGIPQDGIYNVFVHTRDFTDRSGTRTFQVNLAGKTYEKRFGTHGTNGWDWEALAPVPMFRGEYDFQAIDSSQNYARFDLILITDDLEFGGSNQADDLSMLASLVYLPGSVTSGEGEKDPDRSADDIAVKLNGSYLGFDVPPLLLNDRTMVPFRRIFEALGCSVSWEDETQTAIGLRNGKTVRLSIDNPTAKVDGKNIALDQPAVLKDDRTLVPLRFVSEALGAAVKWDEKTQTVTILAQIPVPAFLLRPESFLDTGTWTLESANNIGAFGGTALFGTTPPSGDGPSDANPSNTKPAVADIPVAKEGAYRIWVHGRDFATDRPGTRFFQIRVNGTMPEQKFGTHGETGFRWQDAGIFHLKEGQNRIELMDTSGFFSRCDGVLITQDLISLPPESYDGVLSLASPLNPSASTPDFPMWARSAEEPTDYVEMENEYTKVIFYKVPCALGQVVQNEIYFKKDGQWIQTKKRSEELGVMFSHALTAQRGKGLLQEMSSFITTLDNNGTAVSYLGIDPYKAGQLTWMIPVDYEQIAENQVKLIFDHSAADLTASWELQEGIAAPLVSLAAIVPENGSYSFGVIEGKEFSEDGYEFALVPYRIMGKRVKQDIGLVDEMYAFTPMGTITLPAGNEYTSTQKITKGVAVEASWLPLRWVYSDNSILGAGVRSSGGDLRGTIFAPLLGSAESQKSAGDELTFQYRVISTADDWFDTYKSVTKQVFGVHDYRENYYASLNDAIFNTRDLLMDDVYSGWDPYDKAYYNMEIMNGTTQANPMIALQAYLLSEDQNMLEKRVIPTLAFMLTRQNFTFNRMPFSDDPTENATADLPNPIGSPVSNYNLNVIGGLYEMTRGQIPYLYHYGLEIGKKNVNNSYGSIPAFANNSFLYKYTGTKSYLDQAIEQADIYLENVVYAPKTTIPDWSAFTYISYYPNLSSLLDLYEFTQDIKYLDAAKEVGKWITACLWVPGIDGEKLNQPLEVNDAETVRYKFHYGRENNEKFWWYGDKQFRIGSPIGDPGNIEGNQRLDGLVETVPAWVASRVGLGNEQSSTFPNSANIIMSSWAGDLVRLARYTGEDYFETCARNAVIGRFSNYPGYYQNKFMTYQQMPEYPLEGPDYNGIYWHHIPPFLAMLEDFLINTVMSWSGGQISFPSLRQQGYAYFNSNQYGQAPGTFFGESEMWPWLDRGIADTGNKQIDWLAARKDGTFGLALINESAADISTTVTLGDKVPGGNQYTGKGTVFDNENNQTEVTITNGTFAITVPAKSLRALVIQLPNVKSPSFASVDYQLTGTSANLGQTLAEHTNGKGYVLQVTPDNYYAYVYVTDRPDHLTNLTMKYKIGTGPEQTVSTSTYPYEFIIKVPDPSLPFIYTLEGALSSNSTASYGSGTLKPLSAK